MIVESCRLQFFSVVISDFSKALSREGQALDWTEILARVLTSAQIQATTAPFNPAEQDNLVMKLYIYIFRCLLLIYALRLIMLEIPRS